MATSKTLPMIANNATPVAEPARTPQPTALPVGYFIDFILINNFFSYNLYKRTPPPQILSTGTPSATAITATSWTRISSASNATKPARYVQVLVVVIVLRTEYITLELNVIVHPTPSTTTLEAWSVLIVPTLWYSADSITTFSGSRSPSPTASHSTTKLSSNRSPLLSSPTVNIYSPFRLSISSVPNHSARNLYPQKLLSRNI